MNATVMFDEFAVSLDFYESIRCKAQQGLARLSREAYGFCSVRELFSRRQWREFSVDEQRMAASCVYAMAVKDKDIQLTISGDLGPVMVLFTDVTLEKDRLTMSRVGDDVRIDLFRVKP